MRIALLLLTILETLFLTRSAGATFNCFDTPGQGRKCACIGSNDCSEMRKSGNCKSSPECDNSELGAIICSCKAERTSRTNQ
jgi:hypothetical protein